MIHRYTRDNGRLIKTPVTAKTLTPPAPGEMIALPGKKHRTYRAPVTLGLDKKPLKPPIMLVKKKGA